MNCPLCTAPMSPYRERWSVCYTCALFAGTAADASAAASPGRAARSPLGDGQPDAPAFQGVSGSGVILASDPAVASDRHTDLVPATLAST